jgi:ureidoacrylate peracid hydrolase
MMTDQCVESAVRDACDLGYLVTLVTDACVTDAPSATSSR